MASLASSADDDSHLPNSEWQKKLIVREKVAKEIVSTEQTYINAMQSIVTHFLRPSESILKKNYVNEIFSNIDQILDLHVSGFTDLTNCIETWNDNSSIATAFVPLIPYLKLYKIYCANYNAAVLRVGERVASSSRFANLLETKKEAVGFDLASLLIQPIQRIPRYRLLFEELLKHTPKEHPDHQPIKKSLASIQEVAIYVNESVRAKENQDKLLSIQQSLTGSKIPPIVSLSRIFMKEGTLVKMCRREPKRRYFFLFNDLLVYCSKNENSTYTFHRAMGLSQLRVDNIPDSSGMTNAFQILSNQKSFSVFAESPQDKKAWMDDINKAIQLCYQLNHKQATGKDADPNDIAPVWIPDKLLKNCMLCNVKFTTINRRHHCRKCGKLVCGSCSGKKYKLENIGKVCRVCDICFDTLTGNNNNNNNYDKKRRSVSVTSLPTDTAEAQRDLARRATKKFKHNDKELDFSSFNTNFVPAELQNDNNESNRKVRTPRKKKIKKKKRGLSESYEGTETENSYENEQSEDSETPDFPPPEPPGPYVNSEGFFEFDSEDEDDILIGEFLPPPSRPAPIAA